MHSTTHAPLREIEVPNHSTDTWESKYYALLAITTLQMMRGQIESAADTAEHLGFGNTDTAIAFREMAADLRHYVRDAR